MSLLTTVVTMIVASTLVVGVVPMAGADPADPGQPDPTISAPSDPATPLSDDATPPVDDATPPVDNTTPPVDDATPPANTATPATNSGQLSDGTTISWSGIPTTPASSSTGYIPIPWDISAINDGVYQSGLNHAISLPASYDLRSAHPNYLTPVRDQGGWGTCWAFAATEAAGSALVRDGVLTGYESPVTDRELSPLHLVQGAYNTNTFKADNIPYSLNNAYNIGGNDLLTAVVWSHWYGAQTETAYPYPLAMSHSDTLPPVLTSKQLSSSAYHLISMSVLPGPYDSLLKYSDANVTAIKQAVYTYGAITTSYSGSLMYAYYMSNGANSSFYDPTFDSANHEVLIIGWDDNFAISNFKYAPPHPGAFLIQNSWGAGKDDYFWLSYYDHSMYVSGLFDMVSATSTNYQSSYAWTKQYSYDAIGPGGWIDLKSGSITYANKFTASSNSYLRAAQIVTQDPDLQYKISVYVGAIKSNSPVTGGSARALTKSGAKSVSGTLTYTGYATIPFEKPVLLKKGQKFSIVLTLTAPSGSIAHASVEEKFSYGAGYHKLSISTGQSYLKSGGKWADFVTAYKQIRGATGWLGNANIIGLTSPAPKYKLFYNANGGSVSTPSKTITYNSKIGTLVKPTRPGYTFTGWYTAQTGGSKYTSSKVMTFQSDKTVYAHWKAKKYTAKFNANGGTTPKKSGKKYTSKSVTFNKTYGALPTTKRTGYTFAGWFTGKTGGTLVTSATLVTTTGTRTLYAHWMRVVSL